MELKKQLGKIILPSILFLSIAHSSNAEQPPNKPYKVCPEIVTVKDTPCKVATPTAAIVHRMEVPKDEKDRERVKMVIDMLRELANQLEKDLEKPVR